jgi:hypothetical protein
MTIVLLYGCHSHYDFKSFLCLITMPCKPTVKLTKIKKNNSAEKGKEHTTLTASSTYMSMDSKVTLTGY